MEANIRTCFELCKVRNKFSASLKGVQYDYHFMFCRRNPDKKAFSPRRNWCIGFLELGQN